MADILAAADLPRLHPTLEGDNRLKVDLYSEELAGASDLLAYRVTYHPGDEVPEHHHPAARHVLLSLSGSGELHTPDGTHTIGPGDVALVAEGERHRLNNPHDEDWTFIELCMPAPRETVWTDPDYTPGWVPADGTE
jgi:quercetin dioxygenase-like cupin family protein